MWFHLLILCCFSCSVQGKWKFKKDPVAEWNRMASSKGVLPGVTPKLFKTFSYPGGLWLPDFVKVSSAVDQKALFIPGLGSDTLPNSVNSILFPTTTLAPLEGPEPKIIEMLCHLDRIYVRIKRSIFRITKPWRFLKLGKCAVNQGTDEHYYFLYLLNADCDFKMESHFDGLTVKNFLRFLPTTTILHDLPFNIPVQCNYHRFIHSYKTGIRPKILGGTLYKTLRMKRPILLIPQDILGNDRTTPYNLGDTMYFEVKHPDGSSTSANERIYVNKCFITSSRVPSITQHVVIDKFGCMVSGKLSDNSKFLPGTSMTKQRFSINAGVLLEMATLTSTTVQLFLHCDVSVGVHPPSEGFKACNYNTATGTWTELYGDSSVCSCCASTCAPPPRARASWGKVTSQPWTIDLSYDDDYLNFNLEDVEKEKPSDKWSLTL